MRSRGFVIMVVAACGPGTVEAPPLTIPTQPGPPAAEAGFTLDPQVPYARLFEDGARWSLPTTAWVGPGSGPAVVCSVGGVQRFPAAVVAQFVCMANQALGPVASALPAYGVVATDDGLWITSNAGAIEPPPATVDQLTTLLATQPMRLAATPGPLRATREVDHAGSADLRVEATIAAAARADAWCLTDENRAGTETVTAVVCLRAADGVVGGSVTYRSQGLVLEGLAWGDAPPLPTSAPYQLALAPHPEVVTVDHRGAGKRTLLTLGAAAGTAQQVEYVLDGRTSALTLPAATATGLPATPRGTAQPHPTLTLRGTATVAAVEADGSFRYRFTLATATPSGTSVTPELVASTQAIAGLVYEAVIGRDGRVGARTIRVEHPTPATPAMVGQIAQAMTTFTVLPAAPVGVGARWTTRYPGNVLDREVEITVRSRLSERVGARAVVVSEASIVPFAQPVPKGTAKVSARGTATMQAIAGTLVPMRTNDFTLTVVVEPTDPTAPREQRELLIRTRVLPK